jgi:hypothetical protein
MDALRPVNKPLTYSRQPYVSRDGGYPVDKKQSRVTTTSHLI